MIKDKRVTVWVPAELHDTAKAEAARRGLSLSEVMRAALTAFVAGKLRVGPEVRYRVKRQKGQ